MATGEGLAQSCIRLGYTPDSSAPGDAASEWVIPAPSKGPKTQRQPPPGFSWSALAGLPGRLPCMRWVRGYSMKDNLLADLVAGLTVAVMAVPQSVSFAAMAGLPAAYGLYTAFVPVIAFCVMGSSRHLVVGPVALVSLLLNDGLVKLLPGSDVNDNPNQPADPAMQEAYNHAAIQVSLLVAVLYLVLGGLRLGWACEVLSKPIISAFLTAGAMIISLSQVKYVVGVSIPHVDRLQDILYNLAANAGQCKRAEAAMGVAWIALMVAIKSAPRWHKRLGWVSPLGPITVATLSIGAVWGFGLEQRAGIRVVGAIQPGLPPLTVSWWVPGESARWPGLVLTAALIAAVSLLEAISIAKSLAEVAGDTINANQELLALGACNLAGAAFGAYPSTGSFARSAVASSAGAKSGAHGIVNAIAVGVVLAFLTPVFQHMPLNALAAIVITGVLGLLDFWRVVHLFRVSRMDCAVWLVTFLGCLFVSIDAGLGAGIALGLALLFARTAFARIGAQAPLPGAAPSYRDAELYNLQGDAEAQLEGLPTVVRLAGPLCFANAARLKEHLLELVIAREDGGPHLQPVVLDMGAVSFLDATGLDVLSELLFKPSHGLHCVLADPAAPVLETLTRAGLLPKLGSDRLFVRVHDAVTHSAAIGIGSYATTNGTHAVNGAAEHTVLSMPLLTNDLPLE